MTELEKSENSAPKAVQGTGIWKGHRHCDGCAAHATGLEIFLVPNHVVDGGITGISIMLSHLTGVNLGIFLFLY